MTFWTYSTSTATLAWTTLTCSMVSSLVYTVYEIYIRILCVEYTICIYYIFIHMFYNVSISLLLYYIEYALFYVITAYTILYVYLYTLHVYTLSYTHIYCTFNTHIYSILNYTYTIYSKQILYLYAGDFVDRGSFSFENVFTLLCIKLVSNNSLTMLRGNHETKNMNMM